MLESFGDISTGLSQVATYRETPPPRLLTRSLLKNLYPSMLYSEIRSLLTVSINVSVTAMTSIFSVRTRHFNSSILLRRLRALKLSILIRFLDLVIVLTGALLGKRVCWRDSSDDACEAV